MNRLGQYFIVFAGLAYGGLVLATAYAVMSVAAYSIAAGQHRINVQLPETHVDTAVTIYVAVLATWWGSCLYLLRRARLRDQSVPAERRYSIAQLWVVTQLCVPIWGLFVALRLGCSGAATPIDSKMA